MKVPVRGPGSEVRGRGSVQLGMVAEAYIKKLASGVVVKRDALVQIAAK